MTKRLPDLQSGASEMMALNRAKAIKTVNSALELRSVIEDWLNKPEDYTAMGNRARMVLESMAGASHRTIASLQQLGFLPPCQTSK